MEHYELVQEMPTIERMTTQDRLKHARKRRSQQLKKWGQYEKQLEKESTKKKKKDAQDSMKKAKRRKGDRVHFVANIALLESAARNDLEEVRRLLENKVSPDVTNEDGLTSLHQCCIDDNEEMLKLLLEYGANVNACDSEMWTPLHAAATCGHVNLCRHLIERGAELLAVNADGNMPYDICEDEVTLDYIESEMAKRGITQEQIDNTRLTTERQMLNDLKELSAAGGDLEVRDPVGASMLHIAAANGYLDVVELLLDHHVSVDPKDNESWQPIHAAAYWGQLDILELLVQNGADLDAKTKNNETPFDLSEDPDIKQRILDLKDEIETNKASRLRPGSSRRHKHTTRTASMRRSSLRGEKSNLFKKEAQEEALHFGLRMMQDEEELPAVTEEAPPTSNIDDVTLTFDDHDNKRPKPSPAPRNRSDQNVRISNSANRTSIDKLPGGNTSPAVAQRGSRSLPLNDPKRPPREPEKDPKKDALEAHLQSMFLESIPNRQNRQPQLHFYPPPMMDKAKNGHNNNNNATGAGLGHQPANAPQSSFREGQIHRFVAPTNAPIVGGEEDEKHKCCTIL
ncbi:protein phosphatase 1 regulatory subunit 16A-like isoform X2 [Biomphalaria glabrata]|uniref:Protein phosphatase 1 regulatory subunit 16A-like isoform X2 n=1 Tax=Biomphalaria glabrata TaxID=6526 RepID=A0A9U8EFQ8_BIOGL|nr:protein phosphatase 1 regulatory subunit 16A-like isoform X2 [Biomphalaria glabrata]